MPSASLRWSAIDADPNAPPKLFSTGRERFWLGFFILFLAIDIAELGLVSEQIHKHGGQNRFDWPGQEYGHVMGLMLFTTIFALLFGIFHWAAGLTVYLVVFFVSRIFITVYVYVCVCHTSVGASGTWKTCTHHHNEKHITKSKNKADRLISTHCISFVSDHRRSSRYHSWCTRIHTFRSRITMYLHRTGEFPPSIPTLPFRLYQSNSDRRSSVGYM